jgi:hypothetical protein
MTVDEYRILGAVLVIAGCLVGTGWLAVDLLQGWLRKR